MLRTLGPLPVALLVVGGVAWYHFLFTGFRLQGVVLDGSTGQPLLGAEVSSAAATATTGADGVFELGGVKPPEVLSVQAPGYTPGVARPLWPGGPIRATLEPITLDITVTDDSTGQPLPTAQVAAGTRQAESLGAGRFRLSPVRPNERLQVSAPGYASRTIDRPGQGSLEVSLAVSLVGHVVDARTGKGIPRATLSVDGTRVVTDAEGTYELTARPRQGQVVALVPGYKRATLDLARQPGLDLRLEPNVVKALYLTYYAVGDQTYLQRMYTLLDTTELNAVVIDVKGDRGFLAYRSGVTLADQVGANEHPTIKDVDGLLKGIHDRGAYAIARIVVFKDDLLARNGHAAGLDVAIKDRRTGGPWVDGEGLAWVDPFQPAVWDYNVALAREAIQRGFDEVQFDYIRFPTDPATGSSVENTEYAQPPTATGRVEAIKRFLTRAREAVHQAGGFLSIDTFGYTTWWNDDGGIGQDIRILSDSVDYLSPMVYPSTFDSGLPGDLVYPAVVHRPYDVVYQSLKQAEAKIAGNRAVLRPWIQYFDDYPWATGTRYDAPQIEAQKKAVADAGVLGWMLWDPFNEYSRGGIAPRP